MNRNIRTHHLFPATLLVLGLSACSQPEEAPAPEAPPPGMQGMQGAGMQMDSAMMRRHMQEADSMMARVRADVEEMRRLSPEQWQARLPDHLSMMDSMHAMMQRHMSEEGGAMQHHQHMGEGMGMSGEMHGRMMGELQAIHAETDALRDASSAEVRERMPAHLERIERMLQMMEQMHTQHHSM